MKHRDHEILVCLRSEAIDALKRRGEKRDQWPIALHRALARELGLKEELWPPRPVGRPPGS